MTLPAVVSNGCRPVRYTRVSSDSKCRLTFPAPRPSSIVELPRPITFQDLTSPSPSRNGDPAMWDRSCDDVTVT